MFNIKIIGVDKVLGYFSLCPSTQGLVEKTIVTDVKLKFENCVKKVKKYRQITIRKKKQILVTQNYKRCPNKDECVNNPILYFNREKNHLEEDNVNGYPVKVI